MFNPRTQELRERISSLRSTWATEQDPVSKKKKINTRAWISGCSLCMWKAMGSVSRPAKYIEME